MLTLALVAFAAGYLFCCLTEPVNPPPRWAVTREGRARLVYWTRAQADGRTLFVPVPAGRSARRLARYLNRHGVTPASLDAVLGAPKGGRA